MAERTVHEVVVEALQFQLRQWEVLPVGMRGDEGTGAEIRDVLRGLTSGRVRLVTRDA